MIVVGDISGLQRYLFDVAEEGGRQARRLRARSFFLQLLAETAALRVCAALDWSLDGCVVSAAGKFVLQGPPPPDADARLARAERAISQWLLRHTAGEVSFALATGADAGNPARDLGRALTALQRGKLRPWAALAGEPGGWQPQALELPPLDTPCALCRRRSAECDEHDEETGEVRRICQQCEDDARLGRQLPGAGWLLIRSAPATGDSNVLGYGVRVSSARAPSVDGELVAAANLADAADPPPGIPAEKHLRRRLARHVPTQNGAPVWFMDLAERATGSALLGVLKADVDSLGAALDAINQTATDLHPYRLLSDALDKFFAADLQRDIRGDARWQSIYTVFAGGDDLLLVGPWDVMFDFAGHLRQRFASGPHVRWSPTSLTLSAGLALILK
jgi:CRISPR-associated protein Csm1